MLSSSDPSQSNRIYHNNFVNNMNKPFDKNNNIWDKGYPGGGNYWSDHHDHDGFSGPAQNITGSDGIVDLLSGGKSPYTISGGTNNDWYPLMHQFVVGDMNVDGLVNFGDINPFVLALTNPSLYQQQYHILPSLHGDINQDGQFNFGDINPFVALLINSR